MNKLYFLLIPLFAFLFTGCGIKKELKESNTKIEQSVLSAEKNVSVAKNAFLESKEAKDMDFYVKKENLLINFDNSLKLISTAKDKISANKSLIEKDSSSDEDKLSSNISDIRTILINVEKSNNYPKERIAILIKSKQEAPALMQNALSIQVNYELIVKEHLSLLNDSIKSFPMKTEDLNSKISSFQASFNELNNQVNIASSELYKKDEMDISIFVNSINKINDLAKLISSTKLNNEAKIKELNHSYIKILADMREEHYVIVGRVSWDEDSDWDTEHNYVYQPILIPTSMLEDFDNTPDTIASYTKGIFGSFNLKISSSLWEKLRINKDENFNYSDDSAEFWIEDIKSSFYHKYIIIENDKKIETDWVKVDENTFYSNEDNLGMTLISKPYGFYESETDKQPSPPGLSLVNNPHYGEWKTDSDGHSFFYYYGMYSMFNDLTGNNRGYSRDYYNDYDRNYRNKQPYYSGGYGTFGEKTNSSRFGKSSYSSYTKSSTNSSSIKKAGSEARGRGPGGGGK